MQNKKLEIKDIIFENKDGSRYCKYNIQNITFIISNISNDKYRIEYEKEGLRPKSNITGKIFNNGAKTMKNHLVDSIVDNLKIDKFESIIVVNELWENFDVGELGELVFSISINKMVEGGQFFKKSDNLSLNVDDITFKILEDNHFITFIDTKEILKYENGVFNRYGEEHIEKIIRELLGNYATISRIKEIIKNIQAKTLINRDDLDKDLKLINLKNGMYEVKTGKLLNHSPRYKSIVQIPVNFDEDAKCPNIEKFMGEILPDEDVKTIYESIGYAMIPKTNIRNATCILIGTGANGKSKMLDMIRAFIGKKNISAESLQMLENDKYSTSNLYGKLLNIFADLSSMQMYNNNIFKMLTGDDGQIRGEIKFQPNFYFDNTARMMFSANKLPPVPDDDLYAFFSRMMIFKFENTFEGKAEDKNILKKITTNEEMSGLFNIVIESLKNVLENDKFTYNKKIKEVENEYRMNSDDILVFIKEKVDENANTNIPTNIMYTIYEKWAKANHSGIQSKIRFNKRLKALDFKRGKFGSRGNQIDSWSNCKFKSDDDNIGQQQEIQVNKPLIQVPLVKIE